MRLWQFSASALALGAVLSLTTLSGCGGKPTESSSSGDTTTTGKNDEPTKKKTPVMKGTGTITGTVTFTGDEPNITEMNNQIESVMKAKTEDVRAMYVQGRR